MAQDNIIGRTIDKYEILDEIARGGMATVYKARQQTVNRVVAIKVIDAEYAKDPTLMQRFRREVDLIATLQHPHILPVYDYGQIDNRPYIVMAYMPGGSVHELIIAPGHIPLETVSRILTQTSDALDHAHREQVIHRDLKPSNILLDKNGNAHLADFGIAKLLSEDTGGLTGDRIIGTLSYMAPEMFRKQTLTPAIDIYALGVTLYQMLTEETPYKGDTAQVIGAHLHEPIPNVRNKRPDLPEAINDIIRKAMAKYPEDRFATAGELATAFQRVVQGGEIKGNLGDKLAGTVSTQPVQKASLPQPPKQAPPPQSAADTLAEGDQWYNAPDQQPVYQQPAYQQPYPQQQYPQHPAYPPEASRGGRRKRGGGGGIPLGLLIGVLALLLICAGVGGVAAMIYFGTPQPEQVDSPAQSANGTNVVPTALPTPQATDVPTPTDPDDPTPASTPAITDEEGIRQAVLAFDEAMRLVLETGDTSTIASVARGEALNDRLKAIDVLSSGPDAPCFWDYNHEGIDFLDLDGMSDTTAKVLANVHRSGTVICADGEHSQYAFPGPYTAIYVTEYADGQWWVIDYCPYDNCPEELTND